MSSTQQTFTLSTGPKVDAVHLVGSWDKYKQHLPLSATRSGRWKGTFKFPSSTMHPGSRYWYYYIINNVKVTHDPNQRSIVEPSTKRTLNVLDVPRSIAPIVTHSKRPLSSSKYEYSGGGVAKGRPISPSRIVAPRPSRPYESRAVREADYSISPSAYSNGTDDICAKLESTSLISGGKYRNVSPPSSIGSSLSSRSSSGTSPSSFSSLSDPASSSSGGSTCRCNKYGVTRRGDRVKLDCGGRLCGYSDDSESCSSIDSQSESEADEVPSYSSSSAPRKPARYTEIRPRDRARGSLSSGSSGHKSAGSSGRRRR